MQTSKDTRLGTTVENFKLLSVLGAGSMSVVYLAQRLDDPRVLVAVKVLHYQGIISPEDHAAFRMRFQREARAASQLRNEYILPVLSSGDAGDLPYMVMPVIVGGTLVTRLASAPQPVPLGEIARYLTQLANAIDYAHEQGIVHRDIKPSNILLDEHGHVYLTDFGIARLFDSGDNALTRESAPTLTRTGQVLGTPYYMAPEQIQAGPIGPAADIYALGVVVYQMVTGQAPFRGDTPLAIALQHLQETPTPPSALRPDLPPSVEAVILRALAKDPAQRCATATELADTFSAGVAELDDPMATRAPAETWPFSTHYASSASTIGAATPATPLPQTHTLSEALVGLTIDSYHIDAVIESDDLGTVFMATRAGVTEPVRMRFLATPGASPKQVASYLLRFEQQAHNLTMLRHPNLAPVLGYGAYEGQPYLVTADNAGVAVSAELAQHGAAELAAIADLLDQVVAGLEAAHRRGFLHLSLTEDRIFRQDDGRIVVADVGVRGLLDVESANAERSSSAATSDANAPEQIRGNPVGPYTDVYALGAILYHLLTGRDVFTGATRDDVAQQHLQSTIPPLRKWRPSLPTTLDRVVSQAMAKEPERRFQSPRELAAAYHAAVAHTQQDASSMTPIRSTLGRSMNDVARESVATTPISSEQGALTPVTTASGSMAGSMARSLVRLTPTRAPWLRSRMALSVIAAVLLVSVLGSVFAWNTLHKANSSPGMGMSSSLDTVTFFDSVPNGAFNTDALKMSLTSLPAPQSGHWYAAWLINDSTDKVLPLGKLTLQSGQTKTYMLMFSGADAQGLPGANLLGFGNRIRITDETQQGNLPSGKVVLEGAFPPQAFMHVQHLLVAFPTTPQQQGFLVGLMQQTTLLYQQANGLKGWINQQFPKSTLCAAQSIIDIVEGKTGAHYQPLPANCNVDPSHPWPAGDTYGLLGKDGYLAGVDEHAALAANAPDATDNIRMHHMHIHMAVLNMTGWLTTVDQDALKVLQGDRSPATSNEIVHLSQITLNGQIANGDESVNPVMGEAGATQAYAHGQLLATLTLKPTH